MYEKIDHVAIAVRSLEKALKFYAAALGIHDWTIEEVASQKTRVALLPIGESRIELLEAIDDASPVAAFLSKRGEGLHHICFQVSDLNKELHRLKKSGARLIDTEPRSGAGGCLVAFIHPSSAAGVLIELSERRDRP